MAADWDETFPCAIQCAMHDEDHAFCIGYCFRWDNGGGVVFKEASGYIADVGEIVETPDTISEALGDTPARRHYLAKVKPARQEDAALRRAKESNAAWGKGSVISVRGRYRADFYLCGNRYYFASSDLKEVEAWLEEMNKKKEAAKELERLKGGGK